MEDTENNEAFELREEVVEAEPCSTEIKCDTMVNRPVKPRRRQPRETSELDLLPISELSPAELLSYVEKLREERSVLRSQLRTMQESFQGVQKQKQELEVAYNQLMVAARTQIQFCKDTAAQAYKTLAYMQPLEVK